VSYHPGSWLARVLSLGAGVGLTGCVDNLAICVDSGVGVAIIVEVNDAATGASLADGARGAISEGSYVDSLRVRASGTLLTLQAGSARPGRYDVTVMHPGYQTWHASQVEVGVDACGGVSSRVLHADLRPQP
jgi:hypothetical protein